MIAKWAVLANGFTRIYKHVASASKHLTTSPTWWRCSVLPPRSISADLGYEMDILEKGLRYGLLTYEDILARRGKDPKTHFEQLVKEYTEVEAFAREQGTTIPDLVSRGLAGLAGNMSYQNAEQVSKENKKKEEADE